MRQHLRANLWLLAATLLLCAVAYPLALLAVGQTVFLNQANGSLVTAPGDDGHPRAVGSRLIAQPFTGDEYFWPRPSAVSYNAAASGATNWGANNPRLRNRVARQLGPLVRYRDGRRAGPDVVEWFRRDAGVLGRWERAHPTLAAAWAKADPAHADLLKRRRDMAPEEVDRWLNEGGRRQEIESTLLDLWLHEHPGADLEPVPADMVMASGSGLDPHITLKNARYQLCHRVAAAQADKVIKEKKIAADDARRGAIRNPIEAEVAKLLDEQSFSPLGVLSQDVGVPLVNVLEVNLALAGRVAAAVP